MATTDGDSPTASQRLDKDTRETLVTVVRHTILLTWSFIVLFPLYWLASMSLKPPGTANSLPPDWIFLPTVYNYIQLIQDSGFVAAFANSLVMVSASVVLVLLIGVPAAYVLSRYDIPMERDVLVWILSSRMLPPIAVVLPFFIIFRELNLFDTRIGMVLMYVSINLSLVVWVMKAFFDGIPETLEEAARVDGATQFQGFRKVVLPAAKPGIFSVAIISFIFAWIELLFGLVLTSFEAVPVTLFVYSFIGSRSIEWGMLAAASTAMIVPVVIFLIAVNKYLAAGLSFGVVIKE
ncbi:MULTISPECIES: carbohydrate ABC transporter permease [Haloarcula]|jgi:multiple sugar transport system permease protein|uniref:Sugar ABC transporter permease n=1 Tax=Haloarcula marismortui ATCC 33799 TaxID=662475 RepID=M0JVL6_9EURY|nr:MULTISPECIES: carbohydrate ABC transporter permease [Haloarcula]EMA13232.1 sugar ABC transporter permease [Haloarcula californiae ATCC 33799]RLM32753.1 carbohydrate ABC transporter permease [Haloarcula sp. Atlit-120R]RLM88756.1 carbohydrate ABC transporter permease [Haloarcula sp. Atlit-7R]